MTQGIPYSSSSYSTSSGTPVSASSAARPVTTRRPAGWFLQALRILGRSLAPRREDQIPDALLEDVGLGTRRAAGERHSDFIRLDAQRYARFY